MIFYLHNVNQEFPERLLLTYKPEENSISDDDKSTVEEPQPVASDDLSSSAEAAPAVASVPPPAMNIDSGDLLVCHLLLD